MSWRELGAGSVPTLRHSDAESTRFRLQVDRLTVPLESETNAADLRQLAARSEADVIVLRYPAARVDLAAEMLRTGRTVIFADTLTYWSLAAGAGRALPESTRLRASVTTLLPSVVDELVADIFADYANHYRSNPLFGHAEALAGYQEWARGAISQTQPATLWEEDRVIGVATVAMAEDHVEIELAGIRAAAQGRGAYAHLLAATERLALSQGRSRLWISTQGHNTNVQRAWARHGFEPQASFVTLHLVREGLLGG